MSFVCAVDDGTPEAGQLALRDKDSTLSVPVIVEGRVWGEVWAARAPGQPRYERADLAFAEALATQIAAGVVQADHLARVERLAFTDPLTGLANRRAVDERLDDALARHLADGTDRVDRPRRHQPAQAGQRHLRARGGRPADRGRRRGGQPGQRPRAERPRRPDRRRRVLRRRRSASRWRAAVQGRRGAVPAGRGPADEHRRLLRRRVDRGARPARSTTRSGCSGWPTPRSTAPSGPARTSPSSPAGRSPTTRATPRRTAGCAAAGSAPTCRRRSSPGSLRSTGCPRTAARSGSRRSPTTCATCSTRPAGSCRTSTPGSDDLVTVSSSVQRAADAPRRRAGSPWSARSSTWGRTR